MKAGWNTVKLGEACKIVNGATPSTSVEANWGGPHCWITPAEMGGLSDPYVGETRRTLTDLGLADCSASLLPAGSVILSSRAPIGHVIINTVPMATNQGCKSMIPRSDLDAKFLFYFIKANVPLLESLGTGATFKELSGGKLASIEIPLPPLAEQKRIVSLLDEAFAGIDEAKAKAEACELSASNLFKSRMQDVFDGHNQAWAKKRLADVADFKNGLNFTRQSNGQTLQMVGVGDFQDRSVVPTQALQSVTIDGRIPDDYLLRHNDILTVRSNGSKDLVGRCMLVPELSAPTSFSGFIIRIRLDVSAVSPRFFLHFMKSSGTRDRLMRDGGGANISNINQAKLSELPVSLPPLAQQEEIADQLDRHQELSRMLANQYRQKVAAIDSLRTSTLQRAFAGELAA